MPFFTYKGRDKQGALVQGVLESPDSNTLASQLFGLNITPIEILAKELLEKEVLFKADVEELIGKRPFEEKKLLDVTHHDPTSEVSAPPEKTVVDIIGEIEP